MLFDKLYFSRYDLNQYDSGLKWTVKTDGQNGRSKWTVKMDGQNGRSKSMKIDGH